MSTNPPLVPPPQPSDMGGALGRNIAALAERKREEAGKATRQEKLAEAITSFTGSMPFVYIHLIVYSLWIAANLGVLPGVPKFDSSFVILAMEASVEAIFLSTFVLISQNRTAKAADKRADLDLHINLLAEHELTKLTEVVTAMASMMGVKFGQAEMAEVQQDIAPEAVLNAIDAA